MGSTRTQRVDVRLLAARNTSLVQMVADKRFRNDLYYRLNVFPIDVPPLRDRRDDIPLLVRYFANKCARRMGKQIESIPDETMDALSRYSWPGNIRELQNLIERAVLLSTDPSLRVPLAEILADSGLSSASGGNALEQAERELIVGALRESNWLWEVLVERRLAWASRGRRSLTRWRSSGSFAHAGEAHRISVFWQAAERPK